LLVRSKEQTVGYKKKTRKFKLKKMSRRPTGESLPRPGEGFTSVTRPEGGHSEKGGIIGEKRSVWGGKPRAQKEARMVRKGSGRDDVHRNRDLGRRGGNMGKGARMEENSGVLLTTGGPFGEESLESAGKSGKN